MVKEKIIKFFAIIGGTAIAVLLFIFRRIGSSTGTNKGSFDSNNNRVRQQFKQDRERTAAARYDQQKREELHRSREVEISERENLNREREESADRTGSIINSTRTNVSRIIADSKSREKKE